MSEVIPLPAFIENSIGSSAWNALSWALHNGWVKDYKWYFSEMANKDIGTPFTVMMMCHICNLMDKTHQFYTFSEEPERLEFQKVGTRGLLLFNSSVDSGVAQEFYKLLVEGYLLGTDFISQTEPVIDEDGNDQLEGELKRYWAEKNGLMPKEVILTREIIDDYCNYHNLGEAVYRFAQKLNL